jgi:type I restriction enzyme S subunit
VDSIAFSDVKKIPVPIPPLAEQERIVKLLDEADELRKLRAQADQRADDLIPALFHKMFQQATFVEKTIGQFLDDGELLLHKDGNHGSLYPRANDFGDQGVPFLSATCVTEGGAIDHSEVKHLSESKAKLLRHGWIERDDVLLAHNATVGKVGFYEGDYARAIIGTSLTTFRVNPNKIEPRFLWAALRDDFFQRQLERIMKQALRNQVPITAQRELLLRIPTLPLQKEFTQQLTEIRELEAGQATSRTRLDALFQSMLHRAFNGEL